MDFHAPILSACMHYRGDIILLFQDGFEALKIDYMHDNITHNIKQNCKFEKF
jgi:hypothetical protein